ncbi:MAG: NADPH-dependent FMN reductase [Dehalococcoidia bacterium]
MRTGLDVVEILAVSGSLRAESSNSRLLRIAAELAPVGTSFRFFQALDELPHFNPDIDRVEDTPPPGVAAWRDAIRRADALLISCPEYAHGVPGSFKNALDWLVSSAELMEKPVLILNASPGGGEFAQSSLAETLRMLGAEILGADSGLEPFLPPGFLKEPTDRETLSRIRRSIAGLCEAVFARRAQRDSRATTAT